MNIQKQDTMHSFINNMVNANQKPQIIVQTGLCTYIACHDGLTMPPQWKDSYASDSLEQQCLVPPGATMSHWIAATASYVQPFSSQFAYHVMQMLTSLSSPSQVVDP